MRDVALMASEIATNAYRYSDSGKPGGSLRVAVFRNDQGARLEFTDDGGSVTLPRTPDAVGVSGRGLMIVAGLSDAWGYWQADFGRHPITVWFECAFRTASDRPGGGGDLGVRR